MVFSGEDLKNLQQNLYLERSFRATYYNGTNNVFPIISVGMPILNLPITSSRDFSKTDNSSTENISSFPIISENPDTEEIDLGLDNELESNKNHNEEHNEEDLEEIEQDNQDIEQEANPKRKVSKRFEVKQNIKSITTSTSNISILDKLAEVEKAISDFQNQLHDNKGSINEIDFEVSQNQWMVDNGVCDANSARWIDHGHGLLPFIQKCLRNNARYSNVIQWVNENEMEFKIIDPERFARLWGFEKKKDGMTKRKLSRSLAYLVNTKKRLKRSSTSSRIFAYTIIPESVGVISAHPPTSNPSSPWSVQATSSTPVVASSTPRSKTTFGQLLQQINHNPQYHQMLQRLIESIKHQRKNGNNNSNQSSTRKRPHSSCPSTSSLSGHSIATKLPRFDSMSPSATNIYKFPSQTMKQQNFYQSDSSNGLTIPSLHSLNENNSSLKCFMNIMQGNSSLSLPMNSSTIYDSDTTYMESLMSGKSSYPNAFHLPTYMQEPLFDIPKTISISSVETETTSLQLNIMESMHNVLNAGELNTIKPTFNTITDANSATDDIGFGILTNMYLQQ